MELRVEPLLQGFALPLADAGQRGQRDGGHRSEHRTIQRADWVQFQPAAQQPMRPGRHGVIVRHHPLQAQRFHERQRMGHREPRAQIARPLPGKLAGEALAQEMTDDRGMNVFLLVGPHPKQRAALGTATPFVQIGRVYAANLHKWCCGSQGSALLWVRPDKQKDIHPAVISHFLGEGFTREFAWQGTRDLSAWLAVPHALAFMESLGLERVMAHNHAMAAWAHRLLCRRLKLDPISPLDGSMLGSMAAVALPALAGISERQRETLQQRLYSEFHLEAPLMLWNGQCLLRVSCQVYNTPEQYERLVDAIGKLGT